ncbi:MAG TPA: hypothetical protein VGG64_12235 [Pirellulales bacterium]|jgi:hypothetical protein
MPDIDAEAAGILIENGCEPVTAVAGSVVEEPQPQARPARHPRLVRAIAVVTAIATALFIRWLW